jgi:putative glutamine amidotransferase
MLFFLDGPKNMTKTDAAPWIGMPVQMDPGSDKQYLDRRYSDAIAEAGGSPLLIPLLATTQSIRAIAENLDGILLTGNSSDLDPSLYGSSRTDACGPVQPLRDRLDFFLLSTAITRKIPVLAICYGMQSLNVFLGGSLIQDIPTSCDTRIRHSDPESQGHPSHEIVISAGSLMEPIVGRLSAMVNSTHHQAIERPGQGLDVMARAPDGIVEAVSYSNPSHWMIGVQWHPERSLDYDDFSRKLFASFIAHCRAGRGIDEGTRT